MKKIYSFLFLVFVAYNAKAGPLTSLTSSGEVLGTSSASVVLPSPSFASEEASFGTSSTTGGLIATTGLATIPSPIYSPWSLPVLVFLEWVPAAFIISGLGVSIPTSSSSFIPSIPSTSVLSSEPLISGVGDSFIPSLTLPASSIGDSRVSLIPFDSSADSAGNAGNSGDSITGITTNSFNGITTSINDSSGQINTQSTQVSNGIFNQITDGFNNISTQIFNSSN